MGSDTQTGRKERLLSFVKWNIDATYLNLNAVIASSAILPGHSVPLKALKLLAHKNPKLRILEVGNGSSESTDFILDSLRSEFGEQLYLSYTCAVTSLDAAFGAKTILHGKPSTEVIFFDLEHQSRTHMIEDHGYDLIIITDSAYLARYDRTEWANIWKQILHPLGHLILWDTILDSVVPQDKDHISRIQAALLQSGFSFSPTDEISQTGHRIIARLGRPPYYPTRITLLIPDDEYPIARAIQSSFQESGITCDKCRLEDKIPQNQDMISVVDFGEPYLYNITEAKFRNFINLISNFEGAILWLTPSAKTACANPDSSMMLGLARTMRAELRKDLTVVELGFNADTLVPSCKSLVSIYGNLKHRTKDKDVDPDYEFAIIDGVVEVPRISWTTAQDELSKCTNHFPVDGDSSRSSQDHDRASLTSARFRSDASYLLVGGLGGLGRVVASWMVENGAKHLLFLSRSAKEGPTTMPFLDELRAQGCQASTFTGDVTKLADVEAAIKQAPKPIAGIMQMSASMKDNWMSHMTFSEWDQCVRPKVLGTWNLHHATASTSLDFFLLFSSICGLSGQWGQANYNSANAFLDAFVNFRHGQGLPGSVVDLGFMDHIGMGVENKSLVKTLKAGGYLFLGQQDLLDALTIAIAYSHPRKDRSMNKSQVGVGLRSTKPITDRSTRVAWKKDARMVLSHQFASLNPTAIEA